MCEISLKLHSTMQYQLPRMEIVCKSQSCMLGFLIYLEDAHANFGCTPVQREKVLRVRGTLQRLQAVDAGNDGGQNFRDLRVPKHVRVCQAQIREILRSVSI